MLIRKVNGSDCKDIFVWRNDNLTRKMSFDQSLISIENHDKWFNKILSDQNVVTYLGIDKNFLKLLSFFSLSVLKTNISP